MTRQSDEEIILRRFRYIEREIDDLAEALRKKQQELIACGNDLAKARRGHDG